MLCLNDSFDNGEKRTLEFFGQYPNRRKGLSLSFTMCEPIQETPENKHLKDQKCIVDLTNADAVQEKLQSVRDFLVNPELWLVYNEEVVDMNKYGY